MHVLNGYLLMCIYSPGLWGNLSYMKCFHHCCCWLPMWLCWTLYFLLCRIFPSLGHQDFFVTLVAKVEGNVSCSLSYFPAFFSSNYTKRKMEGGNLPKQKLLLEHSPLTLTGYYISLQMLSRGVHLWSFQCPWNWKSSSHGRVLCWIWFC